MIYEIFMDGTSIFDSSVSLGYATLPLLSPSLELSLEDAGSFSFVAPKENVRCNEITPLINEFEVFENGELIWYGRPTEVKSDFYDKISVYCEGAFAYFNDTITRPMQYDMISLHELFSKIIDSHNSHVRTNRTFEIGEIDISDRYVYNVETDYEKTKDSLTNNILAFGGYFRFRKNGDKRIIDWKNSYKQNGGQNIEFGLNLLDLTRDINLSSLVTSIIPIGDGDITIASVNGGLDYLDTALASIYGRITSVMSFSGITTPEDLYSEALNWVQNNAIENISFDCSAADLSALNSNYEKFEVGSLVRIVSSPHDIDVTLPITSMTIDLTHGSKQITIGYSTDSNLTASI